jgi:hypothetical protein
MGLKIGNNKLLTEKDNDLFNSSMASAMIKMAEEKNRKKNIVWLENKITFENNQQHQFWKNRYHKEYGTNIVILKIINRWNPFKKTTIKYLEKHMIEQEIQL